MTLAELEQPDTEENRAPRTDDQVGQEFQEFARCEDLWRCCFSEFLTVSFSFPQRCAPTRSFGKVASRIKILIFGEELNCPNICNFHSFQTSSYLQLTSSPTGWTEPTWSRMETSSGEESCFPSHSFLWRSPCFGARLAFLQMKKNLVGKEFSCWFFCCLLRLLPPQSTWSSSCLSALSSFTSRI